MVEINHPSNEEVKAYNDRWDKNNDNVIREHTINRLFQELAPDNTEIELIMLKCTVLNSLYSTNIFNINPVAEHINDLAIDERLEAWDVDLVNDIARVNINGKDRNLYSFATKYCSHHNFNDYPIYDEYVAKVLLHFQRKDKFYWSKFRAKDLRNYAIFKDVLQKFISFYGLEFDNPDEKLIQLDRYLWQVGKEKFPKKYKKKSEKKWV